MKIYITIISVFLFLTLHAQNNKAGILDSSFGINGKVYTSSPEYYLQCRASARQSDGSIIAAGTISSSNIYGFFAIKYSPDGVIDTSFGLNGMVSIDSMQEAQAIAIQADDKILVAGYAAEMFGPYYVSITRFNSNGTVDSGFGEKGKILSTVGRDARAIALQPDGKILIEGEGNNYSTLTLRYLPDGTPDVTFGKNGAVSTALGGSNSEGNAIAVQPDGKIVVGGRTDHELFFVRYNSDGSPDQSFGTNGKVFYSFSTGVNIVNSLVLQQDGKIVAVGSSASYYADTLNGIVFRCLPDGSLDKSFGNAGLSPLNFKTNSILRSVVLQKDGRIITGGSGITVNAGGFLVERYSTNGLPDSTFGNNGYQFTTLDSVNVAYSIFLQKDEKIVLGGSSGAKIISGPLNEAIALVRYKNDEATQKQIIITKIRRWLQHHHGITWNASSSISSYAVQRSSDGAHWSTIYHSPFTTNNHYNDPSPLNGANYYRLQTTSTDGAVAYSNIIAVANHEIKISPNPAANILHIEGLSSTNKTQLTIIDFAGNIKQQVVAGNNACNVNIASLHPGNYLLKIEMNDGVVIKKFVKE